MKIKVKIIGNKDKLLGRYFTWNNHICKALEGTKTLYGQGPQHVFTGVYFDENTNKMIKQDFIYENLYNVISEGGEIKFIKDLNEVPDRVRNYKQRKKKTDVQDKT